MKTAKLLASLFCLAVLPGVSQAVEEETRDEAELRREMADARRELAEAAHKVAELGRELGDGFILHARAPHAPRRAVLGVTIGDDNEDGVQVLSVTPGGPADDAGVQAGDVITAIDDTDLQDADTPAHTLIEALADVEPDTEVVLEFRRGDDERSATVVTEAFRPRFRLFGGNDFDFEFSAPPLPPHPPVFLELMHGWGDMELAALSPQLGEYFGTEKGLLVVRAPEDEAYKLRDGDVILAIGGREPENPRHAMRILRSYRSGETLVLDILREREKLSLEIAVPERRSGLLGAPVRMHHRMIAPAPEVVTEIVADVATGTAEGV